LGKPGEQVTTRYEILNRSDADVSLLGIAAPDFLFDTLFTRSLKNNSPFVFERLNLISPSKSYSAHIGLTAPHGPGFSRFLTVGLSAILRMIRQFRFSFYLQSTARNYPYLFR